MCIRDSLHGERTSLGKEELLAQRYPLRTHHHTEEEVLDIATKPVREVDFTRI